MCVCMLPLPTPSCPLYHSRSPRTIRREEKDETRECQISIPDSKKLLPSERPSTILLCTVSYDTHSSQFFACSLSSEKHKKSSSSHSGNIHLPSPHLLDLSRPAVNTLTLAADLDVEFALAFHTPRALHERVIGHTAGVSALGRHQLEHREQEVADAARFLDAKVVLLTQDVGKGPVAQAVDVAELAFAVEDFLRPFAADAQRFGEGAQQLDDLCYVIVVFAVLCARLRVEEVVACDKFEGLRNVVSMLSCGLS